MGSHKKTSLLLIASIALLTFVIILLARFRTDSVPAPAGQAKIEAQTAKPTGEPEVAKSPEAKVDQASTHVKIARSYKSKEKQASDSDDEGETARQRHGPPQRAGSSSLTRAKPRLLRRPPGLPRQLHGSHSAHPSSARDI